MFYNHELTDSENLLLQLSKQRKSKNEIDFALDLINKEAAWNDLIVRYPSHGIKPLIGYNLHFYASQTNAIPQEVMVNIFDGQPTI